MNIYGVSYVLKSLPPTASDNMDDLPDLKRRGLSLKFAKTKGSEPQLR